MTGLFIAVLISLRFLSPAFWSVLPPPFNHRGLVSIVLVSMFLLVAFATYGSDETA